MAIEIRELVVKASVQKNLGGPSDYATKADLAKMQDRITEKVMKKVKASLDQGKFSR